MSIDTIAAQINQLINQGCTTYDILRVAAHYRRIELEKHLFNNLGGKVAEGPFKGMAYFNQAHASTLSPKLLGTYEQEIQDALIKLSNSYNHFLDIGCAEGYYTTGMGLQENIKSVKGVDINPESLIAARQLAKLNNIEGKCDFTDDLSTAAENLEKNSLIMIDVDGSELEVIEGLFYHSRLDVIHSSCIIIETDYGQDRSSNKGNIIKKMEENGFKLVDNIIQSNEKRLSKIAEGLTRSFLDLAIYGMEGRPSDQSWLILTSDN